MPYCPSCGRYVGREDRFCAACGAPLTEAAETAPDQDRPTGPRVEQTVPPTGSVPPSDAPGTPPPAQVSAPYAPPPNGMVYASLGSRAFAQIIDMVIVCVLYWFIGVEIAARVGGRTPGGFHLEGGPALLLFGLWMFGALLYYTVLESSWKGQTVGKMIAKIKVVSETGAKCGFVQALIRNVIRPVDFLFFYGLGAFFILISPKDQRLGDQAAKTLVVRAD